MGTNADAISFALMKLGDTLKINDLKCGQRRAIDSFLDKKDTLVILPTGFGKSLIYMASAFCCDYNSHMRECGCEDQSHIQRQNIAIVVSPLIALMKDQVRALRQKGVSAVYAGEMTSEEELELNKGTYSIVFASPESMLGERGHKLLSTEVYRRNVCGIFVDEGHCIAKWGFKSGKVKAFRSCYSRLAELRSFVHSSTPAIALTATASKSIKSIIVSSLGLSNPTFVEESPERTNIRYSVIGTHETANDQVKHLAWLADELNSKGEHCQKIILFCKTHRNSRDLHIALTKDLPKDKRQLVALFSSVTGDSRKEYILNDFTRESSKIRILLATSAFGMGINVKGLHTVINYGATRDVDDYFQESGRVGRDGLQSHAILFNYRGNFGKGKTDDEMRNYVKDQEKCRREILLSHYGHTTIEKVPVVHNCCDTCAVKCECNGDGTCADPNNGASSCETDLRRCSISSDGHNKTIYRNVPDEVKEIIKDQLLIYQSQLANQTEFSAPQYTGKDITSGFPLSLIMTIVRDCEVIGSLEQLRKYPFFDIKHADKVWLILEELGGEANADGVGDAQGADGSSVADSSICDDDNLSDFDDDDEMDIQRIVSSQYCRATLPSDNSSEDDY